MCKIIEFQNVLTILVGILHDAPPAITNTKSPISTKQLTLLNFQSNYQNIALSSDLSPKVLDSRSQTRPFYKVLESQNLKIEKI